MGVASIQSILSWLHLPLVFLLLLFHRNIVVLSDDVDDTGFFGWFLFFLCRYVCICVSACVRVDLCGDAPFTLMQNHRIHLNRNGDTKNNHFGLSATNYESSLKFMQIADVVRRSCILHEPNEFVNTVCDRNNWTHRLNDDNKSMSVLMSIAKKEYYPSFSLYVRLAIDVLRMAL